MRESDIFPVSFFSQAYDLIQKINGDFQTLESDQVEMFASQMKKHQALILSIHQQMRTMSSDPQTSKQTPATPPAVKPTTRQEAPPAVWQTTTPEVQSTAQQEDQPVARQAAPAEVQAMAQPSISPEVQPTAWQIDLQVTPPEAQSTARQEAQSAMRQEAPPKIQPIAQPPIPRQEVLPTVRQVAPSEALSTARQEVQPAMQPKVKQAPPANTRSADAKLADAPAPPSLNDLIEKKKLSDLRKAFSLNDRFRYRRDLFGGNEEVMNKVITILNNKESLKESLVFLEEKLHWDFSNPTVKDFVKILEIRFL
jgi:hypothetical protein